MKKQIAIITFLFGVLAGTSANAQLFKISATRVSTSDTVSASFNSAEDALDFLDGQNLNTIFGANVDGEAITVDLNYRGLASSLAYDTGANLTLNIDGIISNKVFAGGNRDASVELLKDYFKSDGGQILNLINKRLAAISPSDPLAGNPMSLMSQMVDDDFELAFVDSIHDDYQLSENEQRNSKQKTRRVGNEMGAGVQYSYYDVAGISSNMISISPFSYRRNFGDTNVKLLLKIPVLKIVSTEGAKTYQASSSLGLHIPIIKDYWSIAPMASIGAVGSEDMVAASALRGLSITNKLKYKTNSGYGFHLGTLFGNYKTEKLEVNDYVSDPAIENNILKNSIVISIPAGALKNYAIDLSATNTKFYGTDLYIQNAMDYGIGFVKTNSTTNNEARLDIKYYSYDSERIATIGNGTKEIRGVSANLKFQY